MEDCIFCKISRKEVEAKIEYEDDDVIVFHTIQPLMLVHLLVVPKKHIPTLDDLEKEDQELIGKMFLISKEMAKRMNIGGKYKVVMNVGEEGGQSVFHIHLHLLSGKKMGEL